MSGKGKTKDSKHVKCEIRFNESSTAVYWPGQTVTGTVTITMGKSKKFRGICLRINGFAATFWDAKAQVNSDKKKRKTNFKGREDYFSTITYLVGSDVGNPLEVAAGTYSYPFSCLIPENAPASMESKYGHIRYLVKVSFERPWKHDIVYQQEITVRGNFDLNLRADTLSLPTKAEEMTSFYFGLTEPLIVTASTSRSGYTPGEVIELTIHVNNQSSVDVKKMVVKLQRIDTFISQVPRVEQLQDFTVLEERETGTVAKRQDAKIEENILIGYGVPSDDVRCGIIHIQYELEIVVHPVRSRKRLTLRIPIVLGTTTIANSSLLPNRALEKQREALLGFSGASAPTEELGTETDHLPSAPPTYADLQAALSRASLTDSVDECTKQGDATEMKFYAPRDF